MFYRFLVILWLSSFGMLTNGLALFAHDTPQQVSTQKEHPLFVLGEIVIKTHPNMTLDEINSLNAAHDGKILEQNSMLGLYRLKVSEPVGEAAISYQSHPGVEYARPNYIFAEIGDEFISLFDLELTILKMIPLLRQRFTQLQARESLLRSLLNDKLFSQAAKDEGLQSLPEVQREIDEAVEKTLAQVYEKRILAGSVSEKEMRAYYDENKEEFRTSEQIRGRRILVNSKQEAEEILELLRSGFDFDSLARERSKDPTAKQGGQFGWFGRGRMLPAVEEVVFGLQKGDVSGVIATRIGYYIVKVEDKRGPGQLAFSEVRNRVRQKLVAKKRKEQIERKTKELEEKYRVKLRPEFLSEVQVPVTEKIDLQDIESIQKLQEVIKKAIERP